MPERDASEVRRGTAMGVAAYLLWGLFPLYFDALKPTGPWEILAHRILWTLVLCAAALVILRDLAWIRPVLRRPKLLAGVTIAALLISTNWIVYIVAVTSGHTSDAALGYFLNPLVTVALGVVVLRERLRPLQWVAVGVGVLAFVYLAVVAGTFPVTALALAFSFGLYGLVKNKVGAHLNALQGLTLETAVLAPIAAAVLVGISVWGGGLDFARHGPRGAAGLRRRRDRGAAAAVRRGRAPDPAGDRRADPVRNARDAVAVRRPLPGRAPFPRAVDRLRHRLDRAGPAHGRQRADDASRAVRPARRVTRRRGPAVRTLRRGLPRGRSSPRESHARHAWR